MPTEPPLSIEDAARALAAGELVAFPTETVYGLGARADDDRAVAKIFTAKGRPADHPLIVHVAGLDAAGWFGDLGPDHGPALRLAGAFWPGPLTLIVPRHAGRGEAASGGQGSIGLRMPSHALAQAWLQRAAALGVPGVAGPSANRFGRVSPTRAAHVRAEFGPGLKVLDGGDCEVGIESAIVDCTRAAPALLRPGQLGRARIEAVLGRALAAPDADSPRAAGTLASHYAPRAPVHLFDADTGAGPSAAGQGHAGHAVYSRRAPPGPATLPGAPDVSWSWQRMPDDPAAVAHELFAVLRAFDDAGVASIWVERPPADPAWDGVRDRLQRASHPSR
jgi:L-threonylcarbamoyladenylate synthase